MKFKTAFELLRLSFTDWNDDDAPRLGASLAFYTILSLSPLVLLAVAAASLVFSRESAQVHLLAEVRATAGREGSDAVRSMLASGQKEFAGVFATLFGMATLLFGASGVFAELRSALNKIWETTPRSSSGVWGFIRNRFLSLGLVISVGFVLLVSLLASAALEAATKYASGLFPIPSLIIDVFNFVVSFLGIAALFAFILKYLPETKVEWADVRVGASLTALLFTIGKSLLGLYLGKATPGSAYGAAGSLVVMVIWVYYSAQIFFFGAEFTHIHALWKRGTLTPMEEEAVSKKLIE